MKKNDGGSKGSPSPPPGATRVDVSEEVSPDNRCKLVAQEVKTDERQELLAASPPLEANNRAQRRQRHPVASRVLQPSPNLP